MLNDASIKEELSAAAYGADNRPAWIGAYRPETTCEELRGLAGWAAAHYDYYLTFVREFMERHGRVLDIGSGCGQNTAMLARYATMAVGVEPERVGYEFAVQHNSAAAIFDNCAFPSRPLEAFDYIFCIETIEHVAYEKQIELIDAALGMLREGGRMFITTPNEDTPSGPHRGVWSPAWTQKLVDRFGGRIVKRGWFDNTQPGAGFVEPSGTHHAWVLR